MTQGANDEAVQLSKTCIVGIMLHLMLCVLRGGEGCKQ
jgi:hypothetical protein